jgi:hypothetical protein
MKSLPRPALLFAVLCCFYAAFLLYLSNALPERTATHFNFAGEPDGWMTRTEAVAWAAVFGFGWPLLVVAICWSIRWLPPALINLPRKDYWLAPERREETFAWFGGHAWWFASLSIGFAFGIHCLMLKANHASPPRLPGPAAVSLAIAFLGGVGLWVLAILRRFGGGDPSATPPRP